MHSIFASTRKSFFSLFHLRSIKYVKIKYLSLKLLSTKSRSKALTAPKWDETSREEMCFKQPIEFRYLYLASVQLQGRSVRCSIFIWRNRSGDVSCGSTTRSRDEHVMRGMCSTHLCTASVDTPELKNVSSRLRFGGVRA
jgi:hypothetical protein